MSAMQDRTFAEVGRKMASWLATNDPQGTFVSDLLGVPADLRANAARVEQLLDDSFTTYTKGFLAGFEFALANLDIAEGLR